MITYDNREIVDFLKGQVDAKNLRVLKCIPEVASAICSAFATFERNRPELLKAIYRKLFPMFDDRQKTIAVLNSLLVGYRLSSITEEEQVLLSSFYVRALWQIKNVLNIVFTSLRDDLSSRQTRASTLIAIALITSSLGLITVFRNVIAAPFRLAQVVAAQTAATPAAISTGPALAELPSPVKQANKPTPTPLPTSTPNPKPIPEDLKPKGSEDGFMGVEPMPDSSRQFLASAVKEIASFSFGSDKFKGTINIWRSFIDRFEAVPADESPEDVNEYKKQIGFYECQCSTPLTEECRTITKIAQDKTSYYEWLVSLPKKYNLREDEKSYIAKGIALCSLVNEEIKLWPVPSPAKEEDPKSQAAVQKWINARLEEGADLKRYKADLIISDPLLSDFKDLWPGCGLSKDTTDPFGELLSQVLDPTFVGGLSSTSGNDSSKQPINVPTLIPVSRATATSTTSSAVTPVPSAQPTMISPSPSGSTAVPAKATSFGSTDEEIYDSVKSRVIRVVRNITTTGAGFYGTGFPIKHEKLGIVIITNYHVIEGANTINTAEFDHGLGVAPTKGKSLTLLGGDRAQDIAVLKPSWDIPEASVFELSERDPQVDDYVKAAGFPGAMSFVWNGGRVMEVNQNLDANLGFSYRGAAIFNAQGGGGISGGPVFLSSTMHVIGVYSADRSQSGGGWSGYALMVPASHVRSVLESVAAGK